MGFSVLSFSVLSRVSTTTRSFGHSPLDTGKAVTSDAIVCNTGRVYERGPRARDDASRGQVAIVDAPRVDRVAADIVRRAQMLNGRACDTEPVGTSEGAAGTRLAVNRSDPTDGYRPPIAPPVLEGERVRLEPLGLEHADALRSAVAEHDLWRTWYTAIPSPAGMVEEIERRRGLLAAGSMIPFAVVLRDEGRAVGMTTFLNLDPDNHRLEIGATWLGRSVQGTGVNAEMKLLMLEQAFDRWHCMAVEFRTHWHNRQSRAAIERLGAKQDGVLRAHKLLPDGSWRDTVVFSILQSEWAAVRAGLEARIR